MDRDERRDYLRQQIYQQRQKDAYYPQDNLRRSMSNTPYYDKLGAVGSTGNLPGYFTRNRLGGNRRSYDFSGGPLSYGDPYTNYPERQFLPRYPNQNRIARMRQSLDYGGNPRYRSNYSTLNPYDQESFLPPNEEYRRERMEQKLLAEQQMMQDEYDDEDDALAKEMKYYQKRKFNIAYNKSSVNMAKYGGRKSQNIQRIINGQDNSLSFSIENPVEVADAIKKIIRRQNQTSKMILANEIHEAIEHKNDEIHNLQTAKIKVLKEYDDDSEEDLELLAQEKDYQDAKVKEYYDAQEAMKFRKQQDKKQNTQIIS